MAIERQAAFDYASLAPDVRDRVETATRRLHDLERRTSENIIEMGQHLIEVKAAIGHGNFLTWLESEFGWGRSTAYRMMEVAEKFPNLGTSEVSPSALYLLASESTPEEVRVEFTELAAIGQRVTHKAVKERIAERKRAEIPVAEWRKVDEDTGEILDDEPEIEAEQVDPSDPATFQWQPPPPKPSPNGTATATVSRAESIASRLVKELGRSLALEVADRIYEIAAE